MKNKVRLQLGAWRIMHDGRVQRFYLDLNGWETLHGRDLDDYFVRQLVRRSRIRWGEAYERLQRHKLGEIA